MATTLHRIARHIAHVALPVHCLGCGEPGREMCLRCMLRTVDGPPPQHGVVHDEGVAAKLVRAGKSGRCRRAAGIMTALTVARVVAGDIRLGRLDAITWVPADPQRGTRRGLHLPQLFAEKIGSTLGVVTVQLLSRSAGTPQRGADKAERARNVLGAFHGHANLERVPLDSRVLLVDDVRTTGATTDECCAVLRVAGTQPVPLAFSVVERRWVS